MQCAIACIVRLGYRLEQDRSYFFYESRVLLALDYVSIQDDVYPLNKRSRSELVLATARNPSAYVGYSFCRVRCIA